MPSPDQYSEEDYLRMKNALESDDPSVVPLQPRLLKAVQAYEAFHSGTQSLPHQPRAEEQQDAFTKAFRGRVAPDSPIIDAPLDSDVVDQRSSLSIDRDSSSIPDSMRLPEPKAPEQRLANRSGRADLDVGTSFEPSGPFTGDGALASVGNTLATTRPLGPEQWEEPSQQALLAHVDERLKAEGVPSSPEFAAVWLGNLSPDERASLESEFADREWMKAKARAEAEGKPIVRARFTDSPMWQDAMAGAKGMSRSFGAGMADAMSLGGFNALSEQLAPEQYAELRETIAQNPTSERLGMIGGVMSPVGAPGLIGRGASSLLRAGTGGLGARMAKSGLAGALGAAGAEGIEGVIQGESPEQIAGAIGGVAPYGFFGGMGGELLGTGLRKYRDTRLTGTERGRKLVDLERAGGGARFGTGLRAPAGSRRAMREALEEGAPSQAADITSEKGSRAVAQSIREREKLLRLELADENAAFYAKDAAQRGSARPVFRVLRDIASRRSADGEPLPFVSEIRQAGQLMGKRLARRASVIDDAERSRVLQNPDFDVLSPTEARAMGLPDDMIPPPGMSVAVNLGSFTARQMDEMLEGLDNIAGQANVAGSNDRALGELSRGLRESRDTFGRGWADIKARHAQRLRELDNDKVRVGLRANTRVNPDDERVVRPLEQSIARSTERGNRRGRQALDRLTEGDPAAGQAIRDTVATKAYQDLLNAIEPGSSGGILVSGLRQAQMRVGDPALRALGQPAPGAPSIEAVKRFIDELPPEASELLRSYVAEGFRLPGGIAGVRASRLVGEGGQPEFTDEQRAAAEQMGMQLPVYEEPPTEEAFYMKMWQALKELAGQEATQ